MRYRFGAGFPCGMSGRSPRPYGWKRYAARRQAAGSVATGEKKNRHGSLRELCRLWWKGIWKLFREEPFDFVADFDGVEVILIVVIVAVIVDVSEAEVHALLDFPVGAHAETALVEAEAVVEAVA